MWGMKRARKDSLEAVGMISGSTKHWERILDTFLTKSRRTSRRSTSSASRQSWSASYVRKHSVRSAMRFALSSSGSFPVLSAIVVSEKR